MALLRHGEVTLTTSPASFAAEDAIVEYGGTVAPSWDGWTAKVRLD